MSLALLQWDSQPLLIFISSTFRLRTTFLGSSLILEIPNVHVRRACSLSFGL